MIRFMAPDLASPSGGIKVIYRFVEHLCALGYDARVWHGAPGFAYESWGSTAPVDTGLSLDFAAGDVLVMPETGGSKWSFLSEGQPVVMLCQGMDFVFANSDFLTDEPGDYPGWPHATAAITVSDAIHTFLDRACHNGFPLHNVPVQIEDWFQPQVKGKRIALMPRRRREDLLGAVQLVRRSGRLNDWEIVLIDGMTQQQVAEELGRAAIFLFGAEREGVGLPGAEAMASGCYVVGFTGDGAKEYMLPEHSSVIADSDVVDMCDRTLEAMAWFEETPEVLHRRADAGRNWVRSRHSAELVRERLGAAFSVITAPDSPSLLPVAATMKHYQAFGGPTDPYNRVRVALRHLARRTVGAARRAD
ncbi:glycosyltransferase [Nocardioides KLBMP 9356]|uniref:Glycosyltransferase n=1 Tax=Nocardioides potassii TaxID=2911371 RepID=A0ABS9H760_9ACTN|nr:glycosyltransferase [Nocardioides potassii]MCF6376284.1 glycosyltransferase [Nocardioides potassii]